MNPLTDPAAQALVHRLGWVLVHSLWQGAAVALLLAAVLYALRRRSPGARYLLSCGALALLAALPAMNFALVPRFHPGATPSPARADISAARPSSEEPEQMTPALRRTTAGRRSPFAAEPRGALETIDGPDPFTWRSVPRLVEPLFPWLVGAWAIGIVMLSIYHLGGWVQVQRLRTLHTRRPGARRESAFRELATRLRVTRPVRLLESALVQVPAVVGWLRPVVLVPASAVAGLSPQELEAILAHELAHVRRHDYLVNVLQAVVETVLFYHPAVWWVSSRIRAEREDCCDDLASRACGGPLPYARALAALEELRAADTVPLPRTALAATGGSLLRRIRRLTGRPAPTRAPRPWPLAAAALVLACPLLGAAMSEQKSPAPPESPTPPVTASRTPPPQNASRPPNSLNDQLRLTELIDRRIALARDCGEAQNNLANLKALNARGEDPPGLAEKLSQDERYGSIRRKLEEIQRDLDTSKLGENHPRAQARRAKMAPLRQQLDDRREEIKNDLFESLAAEQQASLHAAVDQLRDVVGEIGRLAELTAWTQRVAELRAQLRAAREQGKGADEQVYAAQLRQAEAERDRIQEQMEKESVPAKPSGRAPPQEPAKPTAAAGAETPSVCLVGSDDFFLSRVLDALPQAAEKLQKVQGYSRDLASRCDVTVLDGLQLEARALHPGGKFLCIGTLPIGLRLRPTPGADGRFVRLTNVSGAQWKRDHPVLASVDLGKLFVGSLPALQAGEGSEVLAETGGAGRAPLIVLHREAGRTFIVVPFRLSDSNWPVQAGFPAFIHQAVKYLAAAQPGDERADAAASPATAPSLSVDDIARVDSMIDAQVRSRNKLKADLARARETLLDNHPTVINLQRALAHAEQDLAQSADEFRKKWVVNNSVLRRAELQRAKADAPADEPPSESKYYISGVPRSGAYSIGKHPVNLLQALIAGGLDVDQNLPRQVALYRRAGGADRETATTLTVSDLIDHRDKDVALRADDMIIVKAAAPDDPGALAEPVPGLWDRLRDAFTRFGVLSEDRRPTIVSAYVSRDGSSAFVAITDPREKRGSDREAILFDLARKDVVWEVTQINTCTLGNAGGALEAYQKKHPGAKRFAKPFSVPPVESPQSH